MSERLMTCVFPCDVRSVKGNPHHVETPFGKPLVVSDGDLAGEFDRVEARAEDAERLLRDVVKLWDQKWGYLSFYNTIRAFLAKSQKIANVRAFLEDKP